MMQKLVVKNFQSHLLTILDLHPGVNCLVGSSDVGKSAIIRALRWLVWNRPQGDAFRSWWGGEMCVTAILEPNSIIERIRDSSNNLYRLNEEDFKAIKAEVPAEIATALNLNEINLQQQFDRPFLLDSSPGEVAQHFNAIAHLDIIDIGLHNVESWRRAITQNIETDQATVNELETQLKQFEGLEELDGKVVLLEILERQRTSTGQQISALQGIVFTIQDTKRELTRVARITKLGPKVDSLVELNKQRREIYHKTENLYTAISAIQATQKELAEIDRIIKPSSMVDNVATLIAQQVVTKGKLSTLSALLTDIISTQIAIATQEQDATKLQNRFEREFPDVCPLCGQPKCGIHEGNGL